MQVQKEKQEQEDAEHVDEVEKGDEVQLAEGVTEGEVPEEGLSAVEDIDDAEDAPVQGRTKSRVWSDSRPSRRKDNERGSVVSKLERGKEEVVIHKRARARGDEHQAKAQDKRPRAAKPKTTKVQRDLFIPTMVTVGNFAKLLKVTPNALRRRMRQVGMDAEASNEHCKLTGPVLCIHMSNVAH